MFLSAQYSLRIYSSGWSVDKSKADAHYSNCTLSGWKPIILSKCFSAWYKLLDILRYPLFFFLRIVLKILVFLLNRLQFLLQILKFRFPKYVKVITIKYLRWTWDILYSSIMLAAACDYSMNYCISIASFSIIKLYSSLILE